MRGQILVDKKSGRRWLYVPEVHLQCSASIDDEIGRVIAFRTDGHRRVEGGSVPTVQWLKTTCQWTAHLDVPDHVVTFALESHRERMELVDDILGILKTALTSGDKKQGLEEYLAMLPPKQEGKDFKAQERTIALEIKALFDAHGGLS